MARTTRDQQDEGLLAAAPDEQRFAAPAPLPSAAWRGADGEPVSADLSRAGAASPPPLGVRALSWGVESIVPTVGQGIRFEIRS